MRALRTPLLFLCGAIALSAQSFEVASIKPNAANDHRVSIAIQPGGRFVASGIPIRLLIGLAYNVRDFQIVEGPSWIHGEAYDINAKAESSADRITTEQLRPMLKALLAERFGLKAREETREMAIYALVPGKSGHKMKTSTAGAADQRIRMGHGQLSAQGISMDGLARQLSQQMGRNVLNKTGLEGNFEVELQWTPDPGQGMGGLGGPPPPGVLTQTDSSGPSIFTAVQEQLGLRLDPAKGPVPIIVIESIHKPTEN